MHRAPGLQGVDEIEQQLLRTSRQAEETGQQHPLLLDVDEFRVSGRNVRQGIRIGRDAATPRAQPFQRHPAGRGDGE